MTISSLSASPYASPLTAQSASTGSASAPAGASGSIGDQLLTALAQSQAASGISSDPLLQERVSLSPAGLGQTTAAPQTYNAQGLLQQVQSNLLLSDPLLQSTTTATAGTASDTLLQSLMSLPQTPTSATPAAGAQGTAATTATGSSQSNANLAQILQQNPALAGVLVESQMDQGMLSMLGP